MKKRMGESGNIFFTLFGAVALVGVVGAATSTLMRGPVGTVVALNQRAKADSQMQIAMKLAMLEAQNNSNDCDNDTFIEPVGAGAAIPGLVGGGRLPQVGSTTNDPWGSPYGYCGWNHGTDVTSTCSGGTTPLLRGHAAGQGTVIAVLSAGPDRIFGSTCVDNPAPNAPHITRGVNGADDLIVSMTYAEANEASGGLWSISSTDPDAITTNRSLDVSTGAQFSSGDVGFTNTRATFGTGSTLDFTGGGLFMLPNECQSASCGNPNKGLMRRFTNGTCPAEGTQEVLQICDGTDWLDIGGAGAIVAAAGNPGEIQYNAAGLMGASSSLIFNSSNGLTVGGDSIFSADLRVNQILRATTLNVSGNSILTGTLDVDGSADFDSTIDVALGATFGSWLRGSDGTSGAPTYSFSSDTDSGLFFSSSALRFSVDGTERMALSAGGLTMVAGHSLGNFTVDGTLTTNDLNVNNNITANRFISRMATTSAALPAFETEPGTGMYSAVDNTLSLVAGGTPRIVIDGTGDVGIGVLSPDAKLDVGGEIKVGTSNLGCGPTLHGAIRYVSGDLLQVCSSVTGVWEDIGTSGGGGGGAASYWTRISSVDRRLYYDDAFVGVGTNNPLDDFHVAGDLLVTGSYTGTPSVAVSGAGARMFFDPESSAFRAGGVSGSQWDAGSLGGYSVAFGYNAQASGLGSRVFGTNSTASGDGSLAIGEGAQATNLGSAALGLKVVSSGIRSTIWGLGDAAGASPIVSGTESFVTIMGDQSGVNMTANQTWALLGGRMLIDQTPAVNPAVSGTLSLDVEGGVGAMQYCDENGVNCFTAASVATGGVTAPGNNRELIYNSGGVLGANPNMTFSSAGNLTLGGTGAITLPSGDGTNRPVASADGMLRYNTALGRFEGYQGGQWRDLITGTALAAGANTQIQFNSGGYFGAVPAFTFNQGEMRVDGTDYNRPGVMRIRGNETVPANYLDATMILESTRGSGSIWSQTLVSNIPSRNGDMVFAHFNGSTWAEPLILADNGRVGIFSTTPRASLDINTTDAILLPVGGVGNRPSVPVDGMLRYNSQNGKFEGHQSGSWQDILTGAASSSIDSLTDAIANYTSGNMFLGDGSGDNITTGIENTSLGSAALDRVTTGRYNSALGSYALTQNMTGDFNTAVGYAALQNSTNSANTALGYRALRSATGDSNVAIGYMAMDSLTTGSDNIAIGYMAAVPNDAGNYQLNIGNLITGQMNAGLMQINGTGALTLPIGTVANRPAGVDGMIRYNSQNGKFEGFQQGAWQDILTGAAGGAAGANTQIQYNSNGSLWASPAFTWNGTTSNLDVQGTASFGAENMLDGSIKVAGIVNVVPNASGASRLNVTNSSDDGYSALELHNSAVGGQNWQIMSGGTNQAGLGGAGVTEGNLLFWNQTTDNIRMMIAKNTGFVAIGNGVPQAKLDVQGSDAILLPRGITGNRPAGIDGMIRYNSQTNRFEGHQAGTWQDLVTIGTAPGAASPSRGIQFNSGGNFAATANFQYTSTGTLLVAGTYTGTGTEPLSGAGSRMFFDPAKAAFRAGNVGGAQWNYTSVGNYSTALGHDTIASGTNSTAMGWGTQATGSNSTAMGQISIASGLSSVAMGLGSTASGNSAIAMGNSAAAVGDYSFAIGRTVSANGVSSGAIGFGYPIGTIPAVNADSAFGLFFGDQSNVVMPVGSTNTMGVFGGKLVIDPRVPAQQLSARGVIDVGAATDAIVLPSGTTAQQPAGVNGMLRYNSQTNKFEGFQGGLWQDILTSGVASGAASPNRGIQFNSGGSFAASSELQYTSGGSFLLSGTVSGSGDASLPTGAGTRMFFDPTMAAFRAGTVADGGWNYASTGMFSTAMGYGTVASGSFSVALGNTVGATGSSSFAAGQNTYASGAGSTSFGVFSLSSGAGSFSAGNTTKATGINSFAMGNLAEANGNASFSMGYNTTASGTYSASVGLRTQASGWNATSLGRDVWVGNGVVGSGLGDGSFAIGLVDDATAIVDPPVIEGIQSMGIFMGNQTGRIMTSSNTMGLFGGKLVIDPRTLATQLTARGVIDVGAATDAIVLPSGTTAQQPAGVNGMLRYNSQTGKFEGFQAGSWQDIVTGAAASSIDSLTDAIANYTSSNIYLGQGVGSATTTGQYNTGLGVGAMQSITTGYGNLAIGVGAMQSTTVGTNSIAIGNDALAWGNVANHIAIGHSALAAANGGQGNIALGNNAGGTITSGEFNIAIGDSVNVANASGNYQLNIGNLITGTMNTGLMQINGTGALTLPIGQTGNRPAGENGMLRYNSQSGKFEGFQAGSWQDIVTGAASTSFLALTDTPSSYAGQANKFVRVNAGNTALEFTDQIVPSVSGQPAPTGAILDDLGDVTIALPTAGQILTYSSGQWVNAAAPVSGGIPAGANTQLQFNSNGAFGAVSNLTWNVGTTALGVTGRINVSDRINIAGQSGNAPVGASLSGLSDVTIAGASAGQILTYSGGKWINAAAAGGSASAAGVDTNIQFNSNGNMGAASTFVYSAAGNLGVGTSSPAAKITAHSANAVNNTVLEGLRLVRENTAGNGADNIGNSMGFFAESNNGTMVETARIESVLYDSRNAQKDADLRFYTLGKDANAGTVTATESMRIDSNGTLYAGRMTNTQIGLVQSWGWDNLGLALWGRDIGLIGEGTAASDMYLEYYGDDGAWAPEIVFYRNRNTQATPYWPNANDSLGRLSFTTNGVSNGKAGGIEMKAAATHNTGTTPGTMEFYTTPTGSTVTLERMSIKDNGRVQIGTGTPRALLDVNGAIQVGNNSETCSAAADRGSIRYNAGEFEVCRDHAVGWAPLVPTGPVDAVCDATHTFSTPGTFGYRVPANFGTLTVRVWGGGAGGGGASNMGASAGSPGQASTIASRGLSAGGGTGGASSTGAPGNGGAGGTATGGTTNTNGNAGSAGVNSTSSGAGGDAPGGGGLGGAARPYTTGNGNAGAAPGGGGSGGVTTIFGAEAGGGGSGAFVERVLTSVDVAPGTIISDIVVGSGGNGGGGASVGGRGGDGAVTFICASGPPNMALNDLNDVTITAPSNGQTLFYSGGQWVNGVGGGGGSIDGLSDAIANYTSNNMYLGQGVGSATTTGEFNTALGSGAMQALTTGTANVAIGAEALANNTNGQNSIAIGKGALSWGGSVFGQIAIGYDALKNASGGQSNIALGNNSGGTITNGEYNIMIGDTVNVANPSGNYQLNIGNLITGTMNAGLMQINGTGALTLPKGTTAQQPVVPVNGMLRYNSQTDKFEGYQAGSWMNIIGGAGSAAGSNTQLQFNSNGSFGAVSNLTWNGTTFAVVGDVTYTGTITDVSDMRLKNNILPLNDRGSMLNKLDQIGTYSFTMKDDQNGRVEFGVMAQEINKVFPELVKVDENTAEKYMSVNYVGLIAPLIEASKELKSENESLKAQISMIEERMASLEGDMNGMKAHTGYGISKAQMGLGMMLGMMLMGGMAGVAMIVVNRRRRQG